MAHRLIQAAQGTGDATMPGIEHLETYIRRWECGRHQLTERYRLLYCTAFGLRAGQFGSAPVPPPRTLPSDPAAPVPDGPPEEEPVAGCDVVAAAHEASAHVELAEQHRIGDVTYEQLCADVGRLARLSDTGVPGAVFADLCRVRARVCRLLERRLWPGDLTSLYVLLGCVNGLLGNTAVRVGHLDAGEELIRAGWAYAGAVGHRPLQGQLRQQWSALMYWRGQYTQARDLAADGLRYLPSGSPGAALQLHLARAAARLGEEDTVRRAIGAAHEAREADYSDELVAMGGQFALSLATHHALAGAALAELAGAGPEAAEELERAVGLYEDGPGEGEEHWAAGRPLAGIDLAVARLRSGALDAAAAALEPALSLPPLLRIAQVTTRLTVVQGELAAPIYRRSAQARDLDEQIADFGEDTVLTRTRPPGSQPPGWHPPGSRPPGSRPPGPAAAAG